MAARGFPGLTIAKGQSARVYRVRMGVPYYEPRNVEIRFVGGARVPRITVDGPGSPHRYNQNGWLCIWHPRAPVEEKWVFEDGLLALLNLIQAHLFKEAWWRETGEWLGPEAPHTPPKEPLEEDVADDGDNSHPRR